MESRAYILGFPNFYSYINSIFKKFIMTIFNLAALIIIIAPLWTMVDVLKDILKELKNKR